MRDLPQRTEHRQELLRLKVIAADGGQPSVSQYLIRWLFLTIDIPSAWIIYAISVQAIPWWWIIFIFAGLICIIVTPYSQRIGDLVAGTILIDTRSHTSRRTPSSRKLEEDYHPRYPKVMQLSDKDINTLKGIINTVSRTRDYDLSIRIAERIRTKLDIPSDQDSLEFLQTLLKDYNYYSTR
ncbi:RDD family protein [Puia sp. P3]|uniref:RDD family protein n=1 Tax=Puia sp. P3 TaxID=3423952 RepID=UPI003D67B9F5